MITTTNRQALTDIQKILTQAQHDIEQTLELLYTADHIALDTDPHNLSAPYTTHTVDAAILTADKILSSITAINERLDVIGTGTTDPDYQPVHFNYYDGDGRRCDQSNAARIEIDED